MDLEKDFSQATLCLVTHEKNVWLAPKLRNIGAGFLNGYGGEIEHGETPERAALRELKEESGLEVIHPQGMKLIGIITFHNRKSDRRVSIVEMHVFRVVSYVGTPTAIKDGGMGEPSEFPQDNLPYERMLPGDREWMPKIFHPDAAGILLANIYYLPKFAGLEKPSEFRWL